ncbi:hypothetical protein [Microbacterium sp. F2]|uniref:hypothetical protein n=1 Tax=Microbacterium sp. F2 TaxID=3422228 RepID=UPI003FCF975D
MDAVPQSLERLWEARAAILTRERLERESDFTHIPARVAAGELIRLHSGRYARADDTGGFVEDRHLRAIAAVHSRRQTSDAPFSHASAAVLWGLPLFRYIPDAVHVSDSRHNGVVRQARGVARHEISVTDDDIVVIGGITFTSLERTVFDVSRSLPLAGALAVADAALRLVAWDPDDRVYNEGAASAWAAGMDERIIRARGGRGIRQARWINAFADGRAQLPGESVSRLLLHDLGFANPRLQVRLADSSHLYFVDFGLDEAKAWGEFDGEGKYTDARWRGERTPWEVVREEKEREDWIRATTHRPLVRWGMQHLASPVTLGRRLAAFGIRPSR